MNLRHPSRVGRAGALLALLASWGSPGFAQAQDSAGTPKRPSIAIKNVAVVDVVRGEVVSPRTVLIVEGRIETIGDPEAAITIPLGAVGIDGHGRYLMPGLVDMHVHLFNSVSKRPPNDWAFPLFVANGVTGVREMRTNPSDMPIVEGVWNFKSARGESIAPRLLAAGAPVSGPVSRRMVREAKQRGSDFIKIFSDVRERDWRAILDEARSAGLPVCGHVPPEVSVLEAATAGQRSNEHLTQVYEACSSREKEWLDTRRTAKDTELLRLRNAQEAEVLETFDQNVCDRTGEALARTEQVQVPTLVLPYFESRGVPKNVRVDPGWRYLRPDERARWERIFKEGYPGPGDKLAARRWDVSRRIAKTLHRAGVRILAGTDAPMPQVYPGFSLHKELELLVEAGLTPADALRAATVWPAEFLGLSESSGSVAAGKRADLLLLDGNPLADIRQTQRIHAVILEGRVFQRPDLDKLLEAAADRMKGK